MDSFDLDFYEYSIICDDPKLLAKLENSYYDPEFDEWLEEFDKEQEQKQSKKQQNDVELPDPDTISWSQKPKQPPSQQSISSMLEKEDYEVGANTDGINDWEKEE